MKILLISDNRYPDGDAGAVRERVLAQMLLKLGHQVFRVGRNCNNTESTFGGVKCYSVADNGKNSKNNTLNLLMFNQHVFRQVIKLDKKIKFDAFLITGLKARLLVALKHYAIKKRIILVYNSVELYSHTQFKCGKISRHYINNHIIAEKILDNKFRVIAISTFLEEMFKKKGIIVSRIPFVLSKSDVTFLDSANSKIELAYVGRPSRRKDFVMDIVLALNELTKEELSRLHLTIVGVSLEQLRDNFQISTEVLDYLGDSISLMGVLPHEQAIGILSKADFTIPKQVSLQKLQRVFSMAFQLLQT